MIPREDLVKIAKSSIAYQVHNINTIDAGHISMEKAKSYSLIDSNSRFSRLNTHTYLFSIYIYHIINVLIHLSTCIVNTHDQQHKHHRTRANDEPSNNNNNDTLIASKVKHTAVLLQCAVCDTLSQTYIDNTMGGFESSRIESSMNCVVRLVYGYGLVLLL